MSVSYIDSVDSGSNYQFGEKLLSPSKQRSLFDLSHLNSLTINNAGSLIPVCLMETVPGDSFEISCKSLLRVLPQVVPLYSRQRLYLYAFYARSCDLWKQAHAYYKKGYTGTLSINKPKLTADNMADGVYNEKIAAESLMDYLGLPIGFSPAELSAIGQVNALPLFMYEKIYQAYFMERNLYINNRAWLPDDEADLRMSSDDVISNSYALTGQNKITLGKLHYRNYPQDYFTSCVPSPVRGDVPTLDFNYTADNPVVKVMTVGSDPNKKNATAAGTLNLFSGEVVAGPSAGNILATGLASNYTAVGNGFVPIGGSAGGSWYHLYADLKANELTTSITLDSLRHLCIATEELERMARTDGSYIQFGQTFFGVVCKNALDYRPILFGASYQSIAFSEVLQTGESTDSSPLGNYAGHGISVTNDNGYLGKIDCDDYGYIMIIASIMPDVYYFQGLDKLWSRSTQEEELLPNRAKMGMVPVLNKELFVSGTPATDNDLFAYQTPFDELRYKPSTIHGKIADPSKLSFFPYTQARKFNSTPTYSQSFFSADDVRKDYLAGGSVECAYTAQFAFNVRAVRPLPYVGIPASIIN